MQPIDPGLVVLAFLGLMALVLAGVLALAAFSLWLECRWEERDAD